MRHLIRFLYVLFFVPQAIGDTVHYTMDIDIQPADHRLEARVRLKLPPTMPASLVFRLHAELEPVITGGQAILEHIDAGETGDSHVPTRSYRLKLGNGQREAEISYSGTIYHPIKNLADNYARRFDVSPGLIDTDGVFLAGSSYWYPVIQQERPVSFDMSISLPEKWHSVSQGRRADTHNTAAQRWTEQHPQNQIYLIAAPFTEYKGTAGTVDTLVFLRQPDQALADRYLGVTEHYLQMYEGLIGEYPYSKFALVENFWETGYGMPSFTLLGPRVIRLPFIPYTSYPHEIVHNWWGNGVYVDYANGNWSEGLTSYLADHLLKENRGEGADYRRAALQKYADFVDGNNDFPLTEFRGRHNSATEAVGYGKTMMVFHMLRRMLGDEQFTEGLRLLYADYRFRNAGWAEIARTFARVAGQPLDTFFSQWTTRTGGPRLQITEVSVDKTASGYRVTGLLHQTQSGRPYALSVPIALQSEGHEQAVWREVKLTQETSEFSLALHARPLRLAVDPAFDLFRRLHRQEVPPAISQAMGDKKVLVVLPSSAPERVLTAYRQLGKSWQGGRDSDVELIRDDELVTLPDDRTIWLFGWNNRFRKAMDKALEGYDYALADGGVTIDGQALDQSEHAVVAVARQSGDSEHALAWLASGNTAALPGLARKLPHYGKYSYLGFDGEAPDNILKGQWPTVSSPLTAEFTGSPATIVLPPRKPLAQMPGLTAAPE
ncbi:M1 family metallopeptidase [Marinobacter orientalis]|uniref:M1 family peptidase n=1 Tax=Marinobacter orientalis TaxID=1928859 RepID=A0A7Y0RCD4_9GAMM|nr:M1 family metallopeptidase [Marinobacter orientalis]NMT63645.1 M1 family peptidase [Marinobacter orientalis]TGX49760.1 M1 family peptidase [Marinobacter orientalis]